MQRGREVDPAPAGDLQVSEVGLTELVDRRRRVGELVSRLHDDESRRGDEAARLQEPIDAGFRDEGALAIGEGNGDLAGGEIGLVECQRDNLLAHVVGDAVPDALRFGPMILKGLDATRLVAIEPGVECRLRDVDLRQRLADRQRRGLDEPDNLELFGGGVSHASSSPSAITLFFSNRISRVTSARASLSWRASVRSSLTSSEVASREVSPASRFLPASRKSFDQR